jgi:hypothetical protein
MFVASMAGIAGDRYPSVCGSCIGIGWSELVVNSLIHCDHAPGNHLVAILVGSEIALDVTEGALHPKRRVEASHRGDQLRP